MRTSYKYQFFLAVAALILLTSCKEQLADLLGEVIRDNPKEEPIFVDLPGDDLFSEGILETANGDLFVTGFGNGSVLKVTDGTNVKFFKEPGEDGLSSAVGLAVDEARKRLWVANFSFATFSSNLKVFDLSSGELIATISPVEDQPSFFNELAITPKGDVFVSDTATPTIWKASADLSNVEVFVSDPLLANPDPERAFGLNGLALTPNNKYLIASVMDRIDQGGGRLVRIDINTQTVDDVNLTGKSETIARFGGSDGMFFSRGRLFMVNVTPPASIITAQFTSNFLEAKLVERYRYESVYNRPTSSAIRRGRLWTVNSQLDHIIDDENGALGTPPDLPFQLVSVPLRELLE